MLRHAFASIFLFPVVLRAVLVVCAMGCGAADVSSPFSSPHSYAAEYVIHISVDGLNAHDDARADRRRQCAELQAVSGRRRVDHQRPRRLHANQHAAESHVHVHRPAGAAAGGHARHGASRLDHQQRAKRGGTLHNKGNQNLDYIASVFDVVHDAGMSTALYAAKSKFELYDNSYNENNGAEHETAATRSTSYVHRRRRGAAVFRDASTSAFWKIWPRTTSIMFSSTIATRTPRARARLGKRRLVSRTAECRRLPWQGV